MVEITEDVKPYRTFKTIMDPARDEILLEKYYENFIDKKTQRILTVAIMVAQGLTDSNQIKYHIIDAKEHGVTKDEMAAIIEFARSYNPTFSWKKAFAVVKEVYEKEIA